MTKFTDLLPPAPSFLVVPMQLGERTFSADDLLGLGQRNLNTYVSLTLTSWLGKVPVPASFGEAHHRGVSWPDGLSYSLFSNEYGDHVAFFPVLGLFTYTVDAA